MGGKNIVVDHRPDAEQHGAGSDPVGGRQIVVEHGKALAQDFDIRALAAGLAQARSQIRQDIVADVFGREHRVAD